jgi:hypothetical protein
MKILLAVIFSLASALAYAGDTPSVPGAKVYFINLKNGNAVSSPVLVQFGLSGMGIAPAGVQKAKTGHHHLLIDTELSKAQMEYAIPSDENHLHFGGGQTETLLKLKPGKHTLQLILGDWSHVPHNPPVMSERITVYVQ